MRTSFWLMAVVAVTGSSLALAKEPRCGVDEHLSGEHCCRAGEDWVPAKKRCVCLEPEKCAPGAAQKKAEKAAKTEAAVLAVAQVVVQVVEFEAMISQLRAMNSEYSRMAWATEAAAGNKRFYCSQIARVMATAQLDTTAADMGCKLYAHALDPENFATLMTGLKNPGLSQYFLKELCGKQ